VLGRVVVVFSSNCDELAAQLLDRDGVTDDIHLFNQRLRKRGVTTVTSSARCTQWAPRSNNSSQELQMMRHRGHETLQFELIDT
jgi:hypothetical protein